MDRFTVVWELKIEGAVQRVLLAGQWLKFVFDNHLLMNFIPRTSMRSVLYMAYISL